MPRSVFAMTSRTFLVVAMLVAGTQSALAQRGGGGGGRGQGAGGAAGPQRDTTTGFVIRDRATITSCGECHLRDSAGYMQRISY